MKKLIAITAIVSLMGLTACQSDDNANYVQTVKSTEQVTTPVAEEVIPVNTEAKTGDVVDTEAGTITVEKVEEVKPGQYDMIKKGNKLIQVSVKIVNKTNQTINYNPYNFQLVNGQGQVSDTAVLPERDTTLGSGDLMPEGTISGTLLFEQRKSESNFKLAIKGNMFSDTATYISLD